MLIEDSLCSFPDETLKSEKLCGTFSLSKLSDTKLNETNSRIKTTTTVSSPISLRHSSSPIPIPQTTSSFSSTLSNSPFSPKSVRHHNNSHSTPILIRSDSFGYGRGCSQSPPSQFLSRSPMSVNSPNDSFFAGSFQESLISGRMANLPSTLFEGFYAVITYSYSGLSPAPKIQIPFNTYYFHLNSATPTPYVGTIELPDKFKIPSDGLLQLTIFNPTQTPIKTFIVKYDLSDMPPKTKTFLRQTTTTKTSPSRLEYAVHYRIISPKKKRFYLYKNIRVVFPYRKPDEKLEPLQTDTLFPDNPKFYPIR